MSCMTHTLMKEKGWDRYALMLSISGKWHAENVWKVYNVVDDSYT